jgi:hypothetical protein
MGIDAKYVSDGRETRIKKRGRGRRTPVCIGEEVRPMEASHRSSLDEWGEEVDRQTGIRGGSKPGETREVGAAGSGRSAWAVVGVRTACDCSCAMNERQCVRQWAKGDGQREERDDEATGRGAGKNELKLLDLAARLTAPVSRRAETVQWRGGRD